MQILALSGAIWSHLIFLATSLLLIFLLLLIAFSGHNVQFDQSEDIVSDGSILAIGDLRHPGVNIQRQVNGDTFRLFLILFLLFLAHIRLFAVHTFMQQTSELPVRFIRIRKNPDN